MRLLVVPTALLGLLLAACAGGGGTTASDPAGDPAGDPASSGPAGGSAPADAPVRTEVVGTGSGVGARAFRSLGGAGAVWWSEERRLVYVTELGYSGCAPTARASDAAADLRLVVTPYDGPQACTMQATHYAVVVDGLAEPPPAVEVSDLGGTSTVPVRGA